MSHDDNARALQNYADALREIRALKAELRSLADIAEAAWRFPSEDALRKLHRAVESARRVLNGGR